MVCSGGVLLFLSIFICLSVYVIVCISNYICQRVYLTVNEAFVKII